MFEYVKELIKNPVAVSDPFKSLTDAMRDIKEYLDKHSTDQESLQLYYECSLLLRRFAVSLDTASKLLRLNPSETKNYLNMGVSHMYLGEYENAIEVLKQGLHLDPDTPLDLKSTFKNAKVLNDMKLKTKELFIQKSYDDAIQGYTDMIEYCKQLDNDYSIVCLLNRAACYYNQNKFEDALKDVDNSLEIYPYYAKAYLRKARILTKLNQPASENYIKYIYLTGDINSISNEYITALKKENLYKASIQQVSSLSELNRIIHTNKDSLIVFDVFASWCGPCKQLAPMLEDLSCIYKNVIFIKADGDICRDIASQYRIEAFPTIIFIKQGQKIHEIRGADIRSITNNINENAYKNIDMLPKS